MLLSRWEAARLLGIGTDRLDQLRREGKLDAAIFQLSGGRIRYRTRLLLEALGLR